MKQTKKQKKSILDLILISSIVSGILFVLYNVFIAKSTKTVQIVQKIGAFDLEHYIVITNYLPYIDGFIYGFGVMFIGGLIGSFIISQYKKKICPCMQKFVLVICSTTLIVINTLNMYSQYYGFKEIILLILNSGLLFILAVFIAETIQNKVGEYK